VAARIALLVARAIIPPMANVADARGEIENLLYRYAERIDAGDFAGVAKLFAHAEIRVAGTDAVTRGEEAIRKLYESTTRLYECGTPKTKHVVTNAVVEVDEGAGRATSRSCFTVMQQTRELPLQVIITGRYRDSFEQADGAWRFATREMVLEQFGDLSHHLFMDPQSMTRG
jgi:3-phenylpropionate/cinnamic acid dioxygenase small subunit